MTTPKVPTWEEAKKALAQLMDSDRRLIFDGYEVHEWKPGEISLLNAERYLRHILTPEHFEQLAALEWVEEKDVDVDRCATSSVPWIVDPSPSAGGLARTGGATLVEAVARARGEGDG